MQTINLKQYYPFCKEDIFVEVSDEIVEAFLLDKRAEAARERKMFRYKAFYSLDCNDGIENAAIGWAQPSPEDHLIEKEELAEYEELIRRLYEAISSLPPMQARRVHARYILDMAGNVGTQSLAVTIRVLMDETLTGRQKAELVLKEMRIGLCNGGLLGILSFVLIGLYIFLFKGKTLVFAYAVSGCIGLSLLVAMLVSSAVGTCIPLFFKKVGVDPAVASGPLITTVNDLVAVITYYGMSWIFLIEMFHLAG